MWTISGQFWTFQKYWPVTCFVYISQFTCCLCCINKCYFVSDKTYVSIPNIKMITYSNSGSGSTSAKKMGRVHADLGVYEFPSKTSKTGCPFVMRSIVQNVPFWASRRKTFRSSFTQSASSVLLWFGKTSAQSDDQDCKLYGFWEAYNKAMFPTQRE